MYILIYIYIFIYIYIYMYVSYYVYIYIIEVTQELGIFCQVSSQQVCEGCFHGSHVEIRHLIPDDFLTERTRMPINE